MLFFSPILLTNVTSSLSYPIYSLSEDLIEEAGSYWIVDSANINSPYNGKLEKPDGAGGFISWTVTDVSERYDNVAQKIDLSDGYRVDTGWIPIANEVWVITAVYALIVGVSYSIYSLHYKGDLTCDIYLGDQDNAFPDTPTYTAVPYTPPTESWKIEEEPPAILTVTSVIYDMTTINTI